MFELRFLDSPNDVYLVGFGNNGSTVTITGDLPHKTAGFTLSRPGVKDNTEVNTEEEPTVDWNHNDNWDYSEYTTIYDEGEGYVIYSNDGSVYEEPEPYVSFHASGGGTLKGKMIQTVSDYSELSIPIPVPAANYDFVGWMPEIPTEGPVDTTVSFYAVFESNIPGRLGTVESDLTDAQIGLIENYAQTMATAEEITNCQVALVEIYNLLEGGK